MRPDRRSAVSSRRRLAGAVVLAALLGLALTGFGPPGLVESSDAAYPLHAYQIPAVRRLAPPTVGARAAVVLDDASGRVLLGRDERRRLPMASTTKIMTALLALERGRLDEPLRIDVSAAEMPGSSLMGLSSGERLTLRDLLYGLLLPSGNDAAVAIARGVAGTEAAFVEQMNRRAAGLGLVDTRYDNPHGLDAPGHYSSAADLARLARLALRNPTFAQIVTTRQRTVVGRATYELRNTNPLLGRPDVEGVKTGRTEQAGASLVSAFRRGGRRVLVVVLNSPSYAAESVALADYAFGAYAWPRLELPPDPFDRPAGSGLRLASPPPALVLPAWELPYLRSEVAPDGASLRLLLAGELVATAPLVRSGGGGTP